MYTCYKSCHISILTEISSLVRPLFLKPSYTVVTPSSSTCIRPIIQFSPILLQILFFNWVWTRVVTTLVQIYTSNKYLSNFLATNAQSYYSMPVGGFRAARLPRQATHAAEPLCHSRVSVAITIIDQRFYPGNARACLGMEPQWQVCLLQYTVEPVLIRKLILL